MNLPKLPRIRLPSAVLIVSVVQDACLVAGFLMLARGLWLMYPPAMWLVCGALLLWVGWPASKPPDRRGG